MRNSAAGKFANCFGLAMMVVIACLGAVFVWFGFQELADSRLYPTPERISYTEVVRRRPSHGWFEVTGGTLLVGEAAWEQTVGTKKVKRAFVPMVDSRMPLGAKAGVLVETKDEQILQ